MSKMLQNPGLPPGAIVETYDDGGARRNDGRRLRPAAQNPWYVLATVAGEQEGTTVFDIDGDLHARNRRFWNGWMCQELDDVARAEIARKMGLERRELAPLSEAELRELKARFKAAFPDREPEDSLPTPSYSADFTWVHFPSPFVLGKCHFAGYAYFQAAHFAGYADFQAAHFAVPADFQAAHFAGYADFQAAHFAGPADFQAAHFAVPADFREAHFAGAAVFQSAHFAGFAYFQGAHFAGPASLREARFDLSAQFSDGAFMSKTMFERTDFKGSVPEFFHRQMHQDTGFTDDPALWPKVTTDNAKDGKRAYTRLRQVAADIYDPDLEHFFLRQEMRCKARIEWDKRAWFHWLFFVLYRGLADSGISVARPFWLLTFVWAFGFVCFAGHFDSGVLPDLPADIQDSRYRTAAGVSFGNLFGFLGINRLYFTELLRDHIPDGLQLVSGMQTVAGVILLFFLGLGLRNRFRLR